MVIDHICKVTCCVNPAHLRAVTPRDNAINNSESFAAVNFKKTHCYHGHPFDEENTRAYKGERVCRECKRIWALGKRKKLGMKSYKPRPSRWSDGLAW